MFSPNFHLPGSNTDIPARRINAFAKQRQESDDSPLSHADTEPIIPVVQELTQELSRADVIAVSTDKDVLTNQAVDAAKEAGLNQLNEFHQARIAGRLSAGHTEDPHAVQFIEKHGLNQGASNFTSETVDALTIISKKLELEINRVLHIVYHKEQDISSTVINDSHRSSERIGMHSSAVEADKAIAQNYISEYDEGNYENIDRCVTYHNTYCPEPITRKDFYQHRVSKMIEFTRMLDATRNFKLTETQKNTVNEAKEALIATSILRKHALLKQVLPEFLRKAEASRAVLARSERRLQEKNYREAGLTGDDLIEQMKEYDQDSRDALKNQQFTDTSYATIKQLGEQVSKSLGMSTQQLSDALKEHGQKLNDAITDAARLQSEATRDAAKLQSDAIKDAATLQSNATKEAAELQGGVAMQAARLATHMGSLQIAQSKNAQLLLSDIYDKLSEASSKKGGASNAINDTYHVVRSLEGGKELLQTGTNVVTSLIGGVGTVLAGGCHIM